MRYVVTHKNISIYQGNNIASARVRAKWHAAKNPGDCVDIWYQGDIVEKFHVGPLGRAHWQLNDFVTNTINRVYKGPSSNLIHLGPSSN